VRRPRRLPVPCHDAMLPMPPFPGHGSVLLDEIYAVAHSNDAARDLAGTLPMQMYSNPRAETPALRLCYLGMPWLSGGCGSFSRHEPPPPGYGSVSLDELYVVAYSNAALRYLADTLPMRMHANACGETPALRLCYFGMSVGFCGFSFQCFFQTSGAP